MGDFRIFINPEIAVLIFLSVFLSPTGHSRSAEGEPSLVFSPQSLVGTYYLFNHLENEVNQYTPRLLLTEKDGMVRGLVWSGTPDAFSLNFSEPKFSNGRFSFTLRAVNENGEELAGRRCTAVPGDTPDRIPYRCVFVTGPEHMVGEFQTGFLVRDKGQKIVRFHDPGFSRPCYFGAVSDTE